MHCYTQCPGFSSGDWAGGDLLQVQGHEAEKTSNKNYLGWGHYIFSFLKLHLEWILVLYRFTEYNKNNDWLHFLRITNIQDGRIQLFLFLNENPSEVTRHSCVKCARSALSLWSGGAPGSDAGDSRQMVSGMSLYTTIWRTRVLSTTVTFKCQSSVVRCDWTFQGSRGILRGLESCTYATGERNYKEGNLCTQIPQKLVLNSISGNLKVHLCFFSTLSHWSTSWEYVK